MAELPIEQVKQMYERMKAGQKEEGEERDAR